MPLIESKVLTDLYEIRRRINEEIKDMSAEERTAYFRRNAQEVLTSRGLKVRTVQTLPRLEESGGEEASFRGDRR